MIKPISPADIVLKPLPDEVIEVFNTLIQAHYCADVAKVFLSDAIKLLKVKGIPDNRIEDERLLYVEDTFRLAGWHVAYVERDEDLSFLAEPYFTFTRVDSLRDEIRSLTELVSEMSKKLNKHNLILENMVSEKIS